MILWGQNNLKYVGNEFKKGNDVFCNLELKQAFTLDRILTCLLKIGNQKNLEEKETNMFVKDEYASASVSGLRRALSKQ